MLNPVCQQVQGTLEKLQIFMAFSKQISYTLNYQSKEKIFFNSSRDPSMQNGYTFFISFKTLNYCCS